MLFKPSNIFPDSIAFDATSTQLFTWTNNGSQQTDLQFKVYKNIDSTLVYDSTKLASTQSQFMLPANALINNNDYKIQITIFSGASSVLSDFVFIKTYSKPTVSMSVPATINTRSYTFNANYTQAQNVPYQRFKFILYNNTDVEILNSNWLYGYNLSYTFEGFETGNSYKIEIIVESSYSLTGSTGKVPFSVSYVQPDSASYLVTTADNDSGGILLDWSPLVQITGASIGTISYTTGKFGQGVQIDNASKVIFNKEIPTDFTINLWVKLPSGFTGDIVTLGNDEVKIGYNGSQYYLIADGNTALSKFLSISTDFFKLGIKSDKIIIETSTYTELL